MKKERNFSLSFTNVILSPNRLLLFRQKFHDEIISKDTLVKYSVGQLPFLDEQQKETSKINGISPIRDAFEGLSRGYKDLLLPRSRGYFRLIYNTFCSSICRRR